MIGRREIILALTLAVLVAASVVSFGQGFGEPDSSFGQTEASREFSTPSPASNSDQGTHSYFLHDQLLKFLLVLAFSLVAVVIIWTRRFALRRWLMLASVIVLGFIVGGLLCPISAVQNVILKISTGYLLLFLVPTVTALFMGRVFCGYVCPFGALQELLHVKRLRKTIPDRWMRVLRWIPVAVLVFLVIRVFATGILTWSGFTPFKAFFIFGGTPLTLAISGLFVVASVVLFRPFCRLLCPLGAWLSLISRFSLFRLRESATCVSCSQCDRACASGVISNGKARAEDCLLCGECIRVCPAEALSVCGKRKKDAAPSEKGT